MSPVSSVTYVPGLYLQVINSARNRAGGVLWLMGIWKMIYDVQDEKNRLMEELSGQGCNLQ